MALKKRDAGGMIDLYGFESREPVNDGYGNDISGPWTERFTQHAETSAVRAGTETVLADRLEGKQTVMLRIRNSLQARAVTTDWRAHDKRRDRYFNVRALALSPDRAFIEVLAEAGVAA